MLQRFANGPFNLLQVGLSIRWASVSEGKLFCHRKYCTDVDLNRHDERSFRGVPMEVLRN